MGAVESDVGNMIVTTGRDLCLVEEDTTGGTEVIQMERIEQKKEEEVEMNVSEKISHDALIHNIDTTLTVASAFVIHPGIL